MNLDEYCYPCRRKMKVDQTGIEILEMTEKGEPYKLWSADVLICPVCGQTIVTRLGNEPKSQQGQKGFAQEVKMAWHRDVLEVV